MTWKTPGGTSADRMLNRLGRSLCCLTLTGCASTTPTGARLSALNAAVDASSAAWIEAFRTGDPTGLEQIFAPDGVILERDGGHSRGHKAIAKSLAEGMRSMANAETEFKREHLWFLDDVAYETGWYKYTFEEGHGDERTLSGRYLVRWELQPDGKWKIDMDVGFRY